MQWKFHTATTTTPIPRNEINQKLYVKRQAIERLCYNSVYSDDHDYHHQPLRQYPFVAPVIIIIIIIIHVLRSTSSSFSPRSSHFLEYL